MPAKNFGIQATGCCRALMSLCKAAKIDVKLPKPTQNERKIRLNGLCNFLVAVVIFQVW